MLDDPELIRLGAEWDEARDARERLRHANHPGQRAAFREASQAADEALGKYKARLAQLEAEHGC